MANHVCPYPCRYPTKTGLKMDLFILSVQEIQEFNRGKGITYGRVWKCCVPHCTQWFCWSLSLWKMAISLGIYPILRNVHPFGHLTADPQVLLCNAQEARCVPSVTLCVASISACERPAARQVPDFFGSIAQPKSAKELLYFETNGLKESWVQYRSKYPSSFLITCPSSLLQNLQFPCRNEYMYPLVNVYSLLLNMAI